MDLLAFTNTNVGEIKQLIFLLIVWEYQSVMETELISLLLNESYLLWRISCHVQQ